MAQSGRATSRLDPQASRSPVRRAAVRRLQRWHRADGRVRSQDGVGTDGTGARLWAWLFVHATELTEMPADLSPGPYRDALELANQATFTQEELQT